MRVGIIDIGTNTFHLMVANIIEGDYQVLYRTSVPVKLGEGKINQNLIIPEAMERGVAALKIFADTMDSYAVTEVRATATSAVRSAHNAADFVARAKSEAGIDIQVIEGEAEAQLIYEGVRLAGAIEGTSVIMDIGGGSVEFILCTAEEVIWKRSYDLGAARLMQQFFHSDPLSATDRAAMESHFIPQLADLIAVAGQHQPETLIGSAGAFETFTQLLAEAAGTPVDIRQIAAADIDLSAYRHLSEQLKQASHAERAAMKGMIPLRVDMIVVAALLTDYMIAALQPKRLRLSTYDLKMGVLATLLSGDWSA